MFPLKWQFPAVCLKVAKRIMEIVALDQNNSETFCEKTGLPVHHMKWSASPFPHEQDMSPQIDISKVTLKVIFHESFHCFLIGLYDWPKNIIITIWLRQIPISLLFISLQGSNFTFNLSRANVAIYLNAFQYFEAIDFLPISCQFPQQFLQTTGKHSNIREHRDAMNKKQIASQYWKTMKQMGTSAWNGSKVIFFIYCLPHTRPNLVHCLGDSLLNPCYFPSFKLIF